MPGRSRTRFLVTGGAGFIGSHLVDALLARGDAVVVLDNLSTGQPAQPRRGRRQPKFRFVHGSVLDELVVDELVHQCDVVVHLAAAVGVKLIVEQPLRSLTTNIRGSRDRDRGGAPLPAQDPGRPAPPRSTGRTPRARCTRPPTGSSAARRSCAGRTARPRPSTRSWPTATTANAACPRSSCGCSTPSARGRARPTAWSSRAWSGRRSRGEPLTVFGDGTQTRCFAHVARRRRRAAAAPRRGRRDRADVQHRLGRGDQHPGRSPRRSSSAPAAAPRSSWSPTTRRTARASRTCAGGSPTPPSSAR